MKVLESDLAKKLFSSAETKKQIVEFMQNPDRHATITYEDGNSYTLKVVDRDDKHSQ